MWSGPGSVAPYNERRGELLEPRCSDRYVAQSRIAAVTRKRAQLTLNIDFGRTYELAPKPLKTAEDWRTDRRRLWERRLDQLDAYLLTMKENSDDDEE
jgi:hypothetical protein